MSSSAEYIKKALEIVNASREKKMLTANTKKELLYNEYPELKKLDFEISSVFQETMKKVLNGEKADFSEAEKTSLELQKKKKEFVELNNIDIESTKPKFDCSLCDDSGYNDGVICSCVKKKATALVYDEINKDVNLSDYTFEKFKLDYYPIKDDDGENPKEIMTKICGFCVKYANEFKKDSDSMLFFGKTGLGKTHLSLSIANEVIKKGYNVIYGPISRIIGKIENEHFSNNTEKVTLKNVTDCDLLILDDLGTEFTTSFVVSTIFDIVNSRILNNKPTIINTNLDLDDLRKKYTDRIVSRIGGNYRLFMFLGEDIRNI